MNDPVLQQIDYDSALKALAFYDHVKAEWADFEQKVAAAKQRLADTQATLQKLNSGQSVAEVQFLFDVQDAVVEQVPELEEVLGFVDAVQAKVTVIRAKIEQGQQLVADEVKYLTHLIDVANAVVQARDGGTIVRKFIEGKFQSWLAQQDPITFPDLGKIQFLAVPHTPPFSVEANIEARLIYDGGFSLTVRGLYFEYKASDPANPVLRIKNPTVTSNIDLSGAANSLLAEALKSIPLPLGFGTPTVQQEAPSFLPVVTVPVSFKFPADKFKGLGFSVLAILAPGKPARVEGSATIPLPADIPILSTGFFFVQSTVTYYTEYKNQKNVIVLSTFVAPGASAGSQAVRLHVAVIIPLSNPGLNITFEGYLELLGALNNPMQIAKADGEITSDHISVHVVSPAPGAATPLGEMFTLDGILRLDSKALSGTAVVTLYKAINGNMQIRLGMDGGGEITAAANCKALGVTLSARANYKPKFKDLVVTLTGSLQLSATLGGKPFLTAHASVRVEVRGLAQVTVAAEALGQSFPPFSMSLNENLKAILEKKLSDNAKDAGDKLYKGLANLNPFNKNSALRKGLASLDIFNKNSEAAQVVHDVGETLDRLYKRIPKPEDLPKWVTNPFSLTDIQALQGAGLNLTSTAEDLNKAAAPLSDLATRLHGLPVTAQYGVTLVESITRTVESKVDLILDQAVAALGGADPQDLGWSSVAFLIHGNTSTARPDATYQVAVAEWGYVSISPNMKTAKLSIPEFADASILHARARVFKAIKDATLAAFPGIHFILDANANDPGPVGSTNPADLPPGGTRTPLLGADTQPEEDDMPSLPLPADIGATNPSATFQVVFRNKTSMSLRVKTTRVNDDDPVVFQVDLSAGASTDPIDYFGGSTRGLLAPA
jgi:hypothetical protein